MMKILLVDDHQIVRDGLRSCFGTEAEYRIVGEATNGRHAIELAEQFQPDLIVMDLAMPDMNGIEAARHIRQSQDRPAKIIILSMFSEPEFVTEAFQAGASGYLLKTSAFGELAHAIREVMTGRIYLSPAVDAPDGQNQNPEPAGVMNLTRREQQVLRLLAEGLDAKAIGRKLEISAKTVHAFRAKIMAKLGLHSLPELTKYALRKGLTSMQS